VGTGDHEEVVALESPFLDREPEVADRTEPVLVRGRPVVMDLDVAPFGPAPEVVRIACIRDDVDPVDLLDLLDALHDPVEHRAAADREQRLREVLRERPKAGRVAGREDDGLHTSAARVSAYGARCTPCSVTIAAIRLAGVT